MHVQKEIVYHSMNNSFMAVNEGCGKEEPGARDTVKKELMDLNG